MQHQLRIYQVKEGKMNDWVSKWSAEVLPVRRRFGFSIIGPWIVRDENRFVWIIGHDNFSEATAAYSASPERVALSPQISEYLEKIESWMLDPVG